MRQSILVGTESMGGTKTLDQLPAEIAENTATSGNRPDIAASWQRSLAAGLDMDRHAPQEITGNEFDTRRRQNSLGGGARRLDQMFRETANDAELLLGVFDQDGVLLWRGGGTPCLNMADSVGLVEGTRWDESSTATTAVSLVMAGHRPTRVVGTEHYNTALRGLYCTAAPITDPRTGTMTGIVGLAGPAKDVQPAATAFATSMAALGEYEISAAHQRSLVDLRRSAGGQLAGVHGPALLVDENGWVADSRGCTAPDSVAKPSEGARQFVPGIGMCMANQVGTGWLLHRVGPVSPIVAELDLRGEPSVTVAGEGDGWRAALTSRHAQILLLLAEASEAGLTSSELSQLIFGDTGHLVTVRAEMSRLRRTVGALITSRPYRLAPGVTVHLADANKAE